MLNKGQRQTRAWGRQGHERRNRADVRRRIKESFFGSEERLRMLTDSLKEGIMVLDRDGDIAFWNRGAEVILGYTEQEVPR